MTYLLPSFTGAQSTWQFDSDVGLRNRLFVPESFSHPAKLHLGLLQKLIDLYTLPGQTILDPMAGSGSLMIAATQQRNVILRDLQMEYVDLMNASLPIVRQKAGLWAGLIDIGQGDARELECAPFDHVIFSPPYGFEVGSSGSLERRIERLKAIDHDGRWHRKFNNTISDEFHYAGGNTNSGNKSGRNYWKDMTEIYSRCAKLLPSGGRMILVIKNHYRRGKLIDVTSQTIEHVESLGICLTEKHGRYISNPSLWQRRRKEQGLPIVEVEDVLVFQKASLS